jgi:hypothetical protein
MSGQELPTRGTASLTSKQGRRCASEGFELLPEPRVHGVAVKGAAYL